MALSALYIKGRVVSKNLMDADTKVEIKLKISGGLMREKLGYCLVGISPQAAETVHVGATYILRFIPDPTA
jgi:hypothetical protein